MENKSQPATGVNKNQITLNHPVKLADRLLSCVTVRRPIVADVRAAHKGASKNAAGQPDDMEFQDILIPRLTGLNPEDISLIDFADYQRIQDVVIEFSQKNT